MTLEQAGDGTLSAQLDEMRARLEVVEATEAIRRLKHRYAQLCDDSYDADGLAALFTEDAVWDAGDLGVFQGREAIHEYWAGSSEHIPFALHFITNHIVDVMPEGDRATGTCLLWEPLTMDGIAMWAAVTYTEEYRKESGQWLFSRMHLHTSFLTPYDEGWVKRQFPAG